WTAHAWRSGLGGRSCHSAGCWLVGWAEGNGDATGVSAAIQGDGHICWTTTTVDSDVDTRGAATTDGQVDACRASTTPRYSYSGRTNDGVDDAGQTAPLR